MNKRILFATVAALAMAAPFAANAQQGQRSPQGPYEAQRGQPAEAQRAQPQERRNDAASSARDRREDWRDDRPGQRWDDTQYNGYYENGRWTYGRPSDDRFGRAGFALGYRPWSVGMNLGYYNQRYQAVDYRRQNLRQPARGSRWVRDDRGDYLLVTRSGRITQVVIAGSAPRDRRQSWRDDRADASWDDSRYNGYYQNSRWTYGPPPPGANVGVVYGYQPWRQGERLGYYNGRYAEVDYRSNRDLRAPPNGYHWVRNDSGDYLLAAIVGGLIAQVIVNGNR